MYKSGHPFARLRRRSARLLVAGCAASREATRSMQNTQFQTTGMALACLLMAGCTVYSPVWKQHAQAPVGPPLVNGSATALVNRCEIVDIRLGSGYKCLDYGFKSTEGDIVRLVELRNELRTFGPKIGHLTESEKQEFTKGRVRYVLYLLALKPSVYVGVPIQRGDAWLYCGDITCVAATWSPEARIQVDATLHWRPAAPAREGSFYFVPGLTPSSLPLPAQGAQLSVPGTGRVLQIVQRAGVWTVTP